MRHRPPGTADQPFTLQIGDPSCIAEITGIDTIADFRRRDMAAGGQERPWPGIHQVIFKNWAAPCVLNIGGISNISPLGDQHGGFDVGPGNCLMDEWFAEHHTQRNAKHFDAAGAWAASGNVHCAAHQTLERPLFFSERAKSTGREYFNREWLSRYLEQITAELTGQDIQATLAELTALTIADAISKSLPDVSCVPVCGGGRLNTHLMQRLALALHAWASAMFRRTNGILGYRWRCGGGCGFRLARLPAALSLTGKYAGGHRRKGARVLGAIYQVKVCLRRTLTSQRERTSAAASRSSVWIGNNKLRTGQIFYVIHVSAVQIGIAHGIHEHQHSTAFNHCVILCLSVIEGKPIGKAIAPPRR